MAEAKAKPAASEQNDPSLLVIDVGKKYRRKHIRRLRKGKGKLMNKVQDLIADLQQENAIDSNSKPVVIVVRQKSGKRFESMLW